MDDVPLFDSIDRVFDDVMRTALGTHGAAVQAQTFQPSIDVRADDEKIALECDVPGLKADDLEVTVEGRALTIRGTRRLASGAESQRVLLGRSYGSFSYRYTLPDGADAEHMTANLADGVLTVSIPKVPEAKPRRILIQGAPANTQLDE